MNEITKILGAQFLGNLEAFLHLCSGVSHDVSVWVRTGAVHVSASRITAVCNELCTFPDTKLMINVACKNLTPNVYLMKSEE